MRPGKLFSHLECALCKGRFNPDRLHSVCPSCGKPLLARYDLGDACTEQIGEASRDSLRSLWRYAEVLPVRDPSAIVTLGEGGTPLIPAVKLGARYGVRDLRIKDESLNPTGSFKARGISVAISRAKELGVTEVTIPSAGNAALAVSAYTAKAGIAAHVFMPSDSPAPFVTLCSSFGAHVTLVKGLITDCGRAAQEACRDKGWFDLSTLKEPYRIEGKKTLGYEIAEQMGWDLPDVIIYPTGGGTGLLGMWKGFAEMEALKLLGGKRPRMVVVQADGCAPIVHAFNAGERFAAPWERAVTVAAGLRVPSAIGDFMILEALRESNGTAISVSDVELLAGQSEMMQLEGVFACPEGGATLAALKKLIATGWIDGDERVVLFNTGTGASYPDSLMQPKP